MTPATSTATGQASSTMAHTNAQAMAQNSHTAITNRKPKYTKGMGRSPVVF